MSRTLNVFAIIGLLLIMYSTVSELLITKQFIDNEGFIIELIVLMICSFLLNTLTVGIAAWISWKIKSWLI